MKRDDGGVRTGGDIKVKFQLLLIAVIGRIDSMINVLYPNLFECRYVQLPLAGDVAHKIIYSAGQFLLAGNTGGRIGANKLDSSASCRAVTFCKVKFCAGGRDGKFRVLSVSDKLVFWSSFKP